MTIGDVLGVIAAISLGGASWGATLLLAVLAFPVRTGRARVAVENRPGACAGRGAGLLVGVGGIALVLLQSPAGPVRLAAFVLAGLLVAIAAVGAAGIVRLMGERIERSGTPLAPFAAQTRAAFLCVLAACLPFVGWFLILPAAAILSLGAGWTALRAPARPRPIASAEYPAAMGPVT